MLPRKREDDLVIEELPDETLVYDLMRHKAHCLNRIATLIWKSCDGNMTVTGLVAAIVQRTLKVPFADQDVRLALEQLRKAHLLDQEAIRRGRRLTRRSAMGRLAAAGMAAMVVSITAPTAAAAAGTLPPGACCQAGSACASGQCVGPGLGHPCPGCPSKCCV